MSTRTNWWVKGWIVTSLFLIPGLSPGCGVSPIVESEDPANLSDFEFADDADPVQAKLPFVEDELLVLPLPGADPESLVEAYRQAGAAVVTQLPEIELTVLSVGTGRLSQAAAILDDSSLIEEIHKDYILEAQRLPDDPLYARQPHLPQVSAQEAWDLTTGSTEIVIAIVDTGVDDQHPDLAAKIIGGRNVYDQNDDSGDVAGHGTLAAGTAAALSNNGDGVAGVAWDSPILAIRATDDAGLSTGRYLAEGILYAVAQGAKVINLSFAPLWSNSVVRAAAMEADAAGSLVVIAAGNGGGMTTAPGYDQALFVGAVTSDNEIAPFSDRGPFVNLVAPGTGIRSTTMGGSYGLTNGTSFSAPIVSGAAALAWSINPDLSPSDLRSALTSTARDLGTAGKDSTFGSGLLDVRALVEKAAQLTRTIDRTPPVGRIDRPSDGDTLQSRTRVTVTASDNDAVADVRLNLDGQAIATDRRSPFQFVLDPAKYPPGPHVLGVTATDKSGNRSETFSITVEFAETTTGDTSTPPTVSIRAPRTGTTVSGNVSIEATASAGDGLARIEWRVDGRLVLSTTLSGQSAAANYLWRTGSAQTGAHTISVAVVDSRGRRAQTQISLLVD